MGRISQVTYPSEAAAGVCNTTTWAATTQVFQQIASAEYGIPAGHWRQTVSTGNGRRITYFDGLWRPLVTREYDTANESGTQRFQRFAYDHEGRTTFASYPGTVHNLTSGTWTDYDALGRTTSVAQDSELSPGLLVTTTQYQSGFQTLVTSPKGPQTTTRYLAWDQPTQDHPVYISHPAGAYTHITRDVFGKPTQLRRSNSSSPTGGTLAVNRTYTYNANQELCRSVEPETGATLMGYDGAGNLKWSAAGLPAGQACETHGTAPAVAARRVDRTYDSRNGLRTLNFANGIGNQTWAYTLDATTRRLSQVKNTVGGAVVANLAYDVQGNLASKGAQTYQFDLGNRLRSAPGKEIGYEYDGHGRRIYAQTVGSSQIVSQYANSGQLLYQENHKQSKRIDYVYLGSSLVAFRERPLATSTVTVKYQHTDALGTPIAVTNVAKTTIESSEYEPYGQLVNKAAFDGPGFTGHVQDAATGLTYMQQRYYDPQLGVFLSVDPVMAYDNPIDQFHRYRYANNNPYLFTDPDGRQSKRDEDKVTGSHIQGSEVAQAMLSNGSMSVSTGVQPTNAASTQQQGSPLAQRADGKLPVPGVVGWKTGVPEMVWTPEQVDSAGMVITGVALAGGGAIATKAGAPYLAAASGGLISGTRNVWRNLSFDGPSPGGLHANGRLVGVRWKGGQRGVRLDLHPINSGSTPILHINYGPASRGEAGHLILFDPRWIRRGGE